jgi:hypothetical protein
MVSSHQGDGHALPEDPSLAIQRINMDPLAAAYVHGPYHKWERNKSKGEMQMAKPQSQWPKEVALGRLLLLLPLPIDLFFHGHSYRRR